ncbi:MAG: SDR family NAD(P)-dependent oxidoreductase [Candidatus Thiodiazotropha sp. (ex Codakia orbicularis)]|nr:SDR family NAD(P)-dependent oxidoreductase [Candidatus Thiodiazotropha sp. (ex Codakia orbicularis)]
MPYRTCAIVTGATGAIGEAIAKGLAAVGEREVVLVARNRDKAERAVQRIRRETGNAHVRFELADLSRGDAIRDLAARWNGPLHILVNNAAITPRRREESPEGVELQFATNVLGYFRMIRAFTPYLLAAEGAQVVNVASYWAGGLDLDDLEFRQRHYNNDTAYRQSKQADRILSAAFAERLADQRVCVNACHPGDVNSTLSNNLGFGGHQSPEEGADTPVWLANGGAGTETTGRYFENRRKVSCGFSKDRNTMERLFEACEAYG